MSNLFDIDIRGLQQTILHEAPRILMEPLSNALDTAATKILIQLSWARGVAMLTVEDNDPLGFERLTDAYTMFAPSTRKADAGARGRFGIGEKEFVALAYPGPVSISTTSGTVVFDGDTRRVTKGESARRAIGSAITARVRLARDQFAEFVTRLCSVIVPDAVSLTLEIDGEVVTPSSRATLRTFEATLPTVLADGNGSLRRTERRTVVSLHEVLPGEVPLLYELGVPVVPHPGAWHINVLQKVPLARSRDAVTPAYLRLAYVAVLDAAADLLTAEEAKADWVMGALAKATPDTVREIVHLVHGANAVIADPSCPEATKRAFDNGRTVVHGGVYTADVWAAIKQHGVLLPAGRYEDLRGDVAVSPDGKPPIPQASWRPEWHAAARYAGALCLELTGRPIDVQIFNLPLASHVATCDCHGTLTFNAGRLPAQWWTNEESVDELLIHELAHLRVADHLSDDFHRECCRLGSRLRRCRARLSAFAVTVAA